MTRKVARLRVADATGDSPSTKEAILAAAGRLFATHTFDRTTTRMLAGELGVNVATIYYHFPDKQSIFFHYLHEALLKLAKDVSEAVSASGSRARDRLAVFVRTHVRWQLEQRGVATLYMARSVVLSDAPPEYPERLSAVERRHYQLLHQIIEDGVRDDGFQVDALAPTVFAVFAIGEYAPNWFRDDGAMGIAGVAELYARLALRMVGVGG